MADAHPRWMTLTGAHNVRDLGGLPASSGRVRGGVLLRGDNLDGATAEDVALLHDTVGLRAIVDLRALAESPQSPAWVESRGVEVLRIPLLDLSGTTGSDLARQFSTGESTEAYCVMLTMSAERLPAILEFLLADGHQPAYVHCAAGKDRTGIVIAVLLAAAGVNREAIVGDYLATAERIQRVRAALAASGRYTKLPPQEQPMSGEAIEAVLDLLDERFGGAAGLLLRQGVSQQQLDTWRELLIER